MLANLASSLSLATFLLCSIANAAAIPTPTASSSALHADSIHLFATATAAAAKRDQLPGKHQEGGINPIDFLKGYLKAFQKTSRPSLKRAEPEATKCPGHSDVAPSKRAPGHPQGQHQEGGINPIDFLKGLQTMSVPSLKRAEPTTFPDTLTIHTSASASPAPSKRAPGHPPGQHQEGGINPIDFLKGFQTISVPSLKRAEPIPRATTQPVATTTTAGFPSVTTAGRVYDVEVVAKESEIGAGLPSTESLGLFAVY